MSATQNKPYHCEDCIGCGEDTCKFTNEHLDFDVETKNPCRAFIPADYVQALNYDTR